jgi:hypothetical protein
LKRTRSKSWRTAEQKAIYEAAQAEVAERSGGLCEVRWDAQCEGRGTQPHHVWKSKRGRGGPDTADNLLNACTHCHLEGIHAHEPTAKRRGLIAYNETDAEEAAAIRAGEVRW